MISTINTQICRSIKYTMLFIACSLCCAVAQTKQDTTRTQKEADFYKIYTLPIPQGIALEVGGMTFLPNDALAVSTRRGEVWTISNPYMKNGTSPNFACLPRECTKP